MLIIDFVSTTVSVLLEILEKEKQKSVVCRIYPKSHGVEKVQIHTAMGCTSLQQKEFGAFRVISRAILKVCERRLKQASSGVNKSSVPELFNMLFNMADDGGQTTLKGRNNYLFRL